jgi:hypothetical protein
MDGQGPEPDESASSTYNKSTGPVEGDVVQVGQVAGGIHFYGPAGAVSPLRRDPWLVVCGLLCMLVPALGALLSILLAIGGLIEGISPRDFAGLWLPALAQSAIGYRLLDARRQAVWSGILVGCLPLWVSAGVGDLALGRPGFAVFALYGPATIASLLAATRVLRGGFRRRQWSTAVAGVAAALWFAVESAPIVAVGTASVVLLWFLVVVAFVVEVGLPVLATLIGPSRAAAWVLAGWVVGAGVAFAVDVLREEIQGSYLLAALLRVCSMIAVGAVGGLSARRGRQEVHAATPPDE